MSDDELKTLALVKTLAAGNRFFLGDHARTRLAQRKLMVSDVRAALANATACLDQRDDATTAGDWKITGADLSGVELSCAVLLRGSVLVVTVF